MHRFILIFLSTFCFLKLAAQPSNNNLIGDWKFYLDDKITFEFLRLSAGGTGLKCFGQTINSKDTLFLDHVTALDIKNWEIKNDLLIINSKNTLSFKINPGYKLKLIGDDKIELTGEHLRLNLYPSYLNRKEFSRTVVLQRAENIKDNYGVKSAPCIVEQEIFSFKPIDSITHLAEYIGFKDLIPHIIGCNTSYEFVQQYNDPPYNLIIPTSLKKWSYGFGNRRFYISFNSEKGDSSETSIVIYYDFKNEDKDYYFSQIKAGKEKKEIVINNNIDIYKTINWQGKYEGKIFLDNFIFVAYYTRDKNLEELLQKCITSFKYK